MRVFRRLISNLSVFSLILLIGWLIWSLFFDPINTIFNVTVETEQVTATTVDNNNSRWNLYDAEIRDYDSTLFKNFYGSLELEKNVEVTITRVANGPIILTLLSSSENPMGTFYSEDGFQVYSPVSFVDIVIKDINEKAAEGLSFLFSIDGKIELGRKVGKEMYGSPTAILRGGEVKLIGNSSSGNSFFEAGTEQLYLGDKLVIENQIGKGYGFALVNEDPGMKIAYRVMSKEAKVIKPGPEDDNTGYVISASLLDKFVSDKFFLGLSIFFGTLLVLISILTFIMDTISFNKVRQENE